ncbi:metallophosphoesterase, partial [uncultured Clostridium sp.]|uniref:metallophosphoesterase family protein n=1 Tax=uncultured Clostridium sp. TaxID=59620 RepID=UPI00259366F5
MELLLVHLTDIHIEAERDFDILLGRSEAISRAIMLHITNVENTTIFLCVTGDITYSGTKEQFVYGTLFIGEIVDIIKKRYNKIMVQVVVIPGNHDCNFEDDFAPTRELLLKNIDISTATLPEIMKSYTTIQSAYFEYADSLSKEGIGFGCQNDKILTENVFNDEQNGITIRFHCINTAWCSSKHEIKGKMHFKIKDKYEKNENDIVVTLMHHDESWLDWNDAENWKDYYKTYSDIVLVGHDHTAEYVYKENYNAASNYFIKGNQLYSSGNSEQSGFNILKIDLCANIQNFFSYKWNGSIYENIIDTKGIPFNRNRFYKSGIELKKTVKDFLENMDMDLFSRYKDTLYLSDIFAYPTLRGEALTNKKSIVHYREKDTIMKAIWEKKFILILGEKEFGKT